MSTLFRRARVLIVDDDLGFGTIASLWFRHAEFQVQFHLGSEGCLEAIDRTGADVVVVDYDMPGLDGCAVIRAARAQSEGPGRRPTKFVLVSAHELPTLEGLAHSAGADAFLSKLDGGQALVELVRSLVGPGPTRTVDS